NLFYNQYTAEFYCSTFEFDRNGGHNSIIKLYSIDAPVLSSNFFTKSNTHNSKWIISLLMVALGVTAYLIYKFTKKKRQIVIRNNADLEDSSQITQLLISDVIHLNHEPENYN